MQYFVLPIVLVILFELLGQAVCSKLNIRKFKSNIIIGFGTFIGIYYAIGFPFVLLHTRFVYFLIVSLIYFLLILIFIFHCRKEIKLEYSLGHIVLILILVFIQIYFASRSTIGSLSQYDTINYTNLITGNIYSNGLNTTEYMNGFSGSQNTYALQGYYNLAAVLYYLMNGICSKLHIDFFYFTQHTWMYSIILYVLFSEMILNFISYFRISKKRSYLLIALFILLFMGNFYWNSEQAYLGNSFRMILVSYSLIYLLDYDELREKNILFIFILLTWANCACASSNTTLALIMNFGLWIYFKDNEDLIRSYLIGLSLPMANLVFTLKDNVFLTISALLILIVLSLYPKLIIFVSEKLRLKKIVPWLIALLLLGLSFNITHNLFDFDAFLNNLSGWSDMTWDYTDNSTLWRLSANVVYLVLILFAYIPNRGNCLYKSLMGIALIFFNPFAAPIQNQYMIVFYRNYDIVINYFILFTGIKNMECIKNEYLSILSYASLIVLSAYSGYKQYLYHPNDSFKKSDDYNEILRMTNDEADTIRFVKDYVLSNNKTGNIKTISSILQIHTEVPWTKTLYGRNKSFNGISDEWELYKVFYPADYYNDPYAPENPQYDKMCEYISNNRYELIVQDKNAVYYDEDSDTYYSITYLIDECGSYPIYQNDNFAVYAYQYE